MNVNVLNESLLYYFYAVLRSQSRKELHHLSGAVAQHYAAPAPNLMFNIGGISKMSQL
jgi:hypothetical protein